MVPTTSSIMLTTVAKIGRWIEISEISMAGVYYGHPMDQVDVVIVGAGVVGLAVARALAAAGREVLILEAESAFGTGISARNSEVIHAGIYYPRGSLKARLCVAGRDRLYAYCNERGVPHRRCGKLIVATSEAQLGELAKIQAAAAANGVALDLLPASEARALEPALSCTGALSSPSTGIVDSHAYMLALLGDAEAHGATLVCGSGVKSAEVHADGIELHLEQGEDTLRAKLLVNCAGLGAPQLAGAIRGFPQQHVPRAWLATGHYFTLSGRSPFQRLVYPVPEPGGLGIHLTLDLAGRARFGPDVQWIERLDYEVAAAHGEKFYAAIRRYWPALADGSLQPAYAGIRPKISGPGEPAADFRIEGPEAHGVPGVINLFGIESPGLTASLAIAEQVQLMTVR
jgi:L-2-hydroxyglutarate oxidase LhgO